MARRSTFKVLAGLALLSVSVGAQPPRITNGELTNQPAPAPLVASVKAMVASLDEVTWIGYAVPSPRRESMSCCFSSGDGYVSGTVVGGSQWATGCRIEPSADSRPANAPSAGQGLTGPIKLEGPERAFVMIRVADRRVERIRAFSEGCDLDAGGRPVRWLENVRPDDSVALLESLTVDAERRDRTVSGALSALAMHAAPAATTALTRLGREHPAPSVRGEAIFWLAQKAGEKAAGEITARIEQDPDTEVKRRAVFALSQLPNDEAVPLLIRIARTHDNPAVRKQAFFWLGQTKDPRAVEFFAEILR
jgi:hypothetical protein